MTTTTGMVSNAYTLPATSATYNVKYIQAHDFVTDYNYLLPNIPASDMKLNFTAGTLYGKALTGKSFSLSNLAPLTFARSHSYTVNIKLKTPLYLFHDGTVGVLAEKGSRTPIGLVADEKTNTHDGTAAALKEVNGGTQYAWGIVNGVLENNRQYSVSTEQQVAFQKAAAGDDGYDNTWGLSKDGVTIKGNEQTRYPAFYAAGHYGDELAASGVAVTGNMVGKKWFLGSVKEWIQLWKGEIPGGLGHRPIADYGVLFTSAGGSFTSGWHGMITSSEGDDGEYMSLYFNHEMDFFNMWENNKVTSPSEVRAFVHF